MQMGKVELTGPEDKEGFAMIAWSISWATMKRVRLLSKRKVSARAFIGDERVDQALGAL